MFRVVTNSSAKPFKKEVKEPKQEKKKKTDTIEKDIIETSNSN